MAKKQKKVDSNPKPRPVFVDVFREIMRLDDRLLDNFSEALNGGPVMTTFEGVEMTIYPVAKQIYADAFEAAKIELLDRLMKESG